MKEVKEMINAEKGTCITCVHSYVCKYQDNFEKLLAQARALNSSVDTKHCEVGARCKHYREGLLNKYGAEGMKG